MTTDDRPPGGTGSPPARRRAERVRPGPLRVRLHRACEGFLINLSETGALVQLPVAQAPQKLVTLQVEWGEVTLRLRARVVRSSPQRVELPTATLVRSEYQVAVEFSDGEAAAAVRPIIQNN